MKVKTSELSGATLDWVVFQIESPRSKAYLSSRHPNECWVNLAPTGHDVYAPSTDWSQGGPIIERELIQINPKWHNHQVAVNPDWKERGYAAEFGWHWEAHLLGPENIDDPFTQDGATSLTAAMRCYVAYKLGEEIEIPDELIK